MVKLLICGDVEDQFDLFFKRINTLHQSNNGPFDMIFCIGTFFSSQSLSNCLDDYILENGKKKNSSNIDHLPPIYILEKCKSINNEKYSILLPNDGSGCQISNNIHYLGTGGIITLQNLTIGYLSDSHTEKDLSTITSISRNSGFMGCDLLLTSEWGQGVISEKQMEKELLILDEKLHIRMGGDIDVSDVATCVKPRYHFAANHGVFYQRKPYRNHVSIPNRKTSHITRFLSLGKVMKTKDKMKKWLYAIQCDPIPYMSREALLTEPVDTTGSPYNRLNSNNMMMIGSSSSNNNNSDSIIDQDNKNKNNKDSPAFIRKVENEEAKKKNVNTTGGMMRWGEIAKKIDHNGGKGGGKGGGKEGTGGGGKRKRESFDREIDPNKTTLFLGGFGDAGLLGTLVQEIDLQNEFEKYGTITNIMMKNAKGFAFVEFENHESASIALSSYEESSDNVYNDKKSDASSKFKKIIIKGIPISLGWANVNKAEKLAQERRDHFDAKKKQRILKPSRTMKECWFCLSSDEIETHLIVDIGEELYMCYPKGPLAADHFLIVPVEHKSAFTELSEDGIKEVRNYKKAVRDYYASKGYQMILFERRIVSKGQNHTHLQCIPIPNEKASEVIPKYKEKAEEYDIDFKTMAPENELFDYEIGYDQQYFYMELPKEIINDDETKTIDIEKLICRLDTDAKMPMQFGREVAAELLGITERIDWKKCVGTKEEDTAMVEKTKIEFEPFQFS